EFIPELNGSGLRMREYFKASQAILTFGVRPQPPAGGHDHWPVCSMLTWLPALNTDWALSAHPRRSCESVEGAATYRTRAPAELRFTSQAVTGRKPAGSPIH